MFLSDLLELAGFVCLVVAAAMLSPILGFAAAGVALLIIGASLDGARVTLPKVRIPKMAWPKLKAGRPRPVPEAR